MLQVIELEVGDEESIFELGGRRLQQLLEPGLHLWKAGHFVNFEDFKDFWRSDFPMVMMVIRTMAMTEGMTMVTPTVPALGTRTPPFKKFI